MQGRVIKLFAARKSKCPKRGPGLPTLKAHSAFEGIGSKNSNINDCVLMELDSVLYVGVLEFKTKKGYDESKAARQLLAGRRIIVSLLSRYTTSKKYDISLIVVAKSHNDSAKRAFHQALKSSGGDRPKVLMAKCNDTFKDVRNRLRDF